MDGHGPRGGPVALLCTVRPSRSHENTSLRHWFPDRRLLDRESRQSPLLVSNDQAKGRRSPSRRVGRSSEKRPSIRICGARVSLRLEQTGVSGIDLKNTAGRATAGLAWGREKFPTPRSLENGPEQVSTGIKKWVCGVPQLVSRLRNTRPKT